MADSEVTALSDLAHTLGLPFIEELPEPQPPTDNTSGDLDRILGAWGRANGCIPLKGDEHSVTIATCQPTNLLAIDALKLCYKRKLELVITTPDNITKAINSMRTKLMSGRTNELEKDANESDSSDILKVDVTDADDVDAPIIRYVNAIIFKASSQRASDVHLESFESKLKIRFRIDGVLYDIATEERSFQAAIISRIKVMAGLNIAEKRLPQDGRIGVKIAGRDVDIRVSTIPTQFGERVVLRLLDKTATVLDLETLGMSSETMAQMQDLIQRPNGIILVTGPTGSGKTTTLYSCLARINSQEINILTVEDPIEYQLEGIGQMQVNPKIQFTFASGLRAILRQDPDVVMVGEIRDHETAEIAIQASLTGHLVLSTLHTNDAPGAITRLIDMGTEPFLVSSSLLAVLAQRLVRRLCPHCKQPHTLLDEELKELGLSPSQVKNRGAFRPGTTDCSFCSGTRYVGREGIYELLMLTDSVRSLILQRIDSLSIRQAAQRDGMKSLRIDGARKVLEGVTSVEEVLMVTHDDGKEDA